MAIAHNSRRCSFLFLVKNKTVSYKAIVLWFKNWGNGILLKKKSKGKRVYANDNGFAVKTKWDEDL